MSDFESIYQQYGKTVYFFLLSLTQNESLSEELTQETMCRAIMNIGAFCGESKMSVASRFDTTLIAVRTSISSWSMPVPCFFWASYILFTSLEGAVCFALSTTHWR